MGLLNWITKRTIKHASRGNFKYLKRKPIQMTGGGHCQENINYLLKHRLKFGIDREYTNGVRLGNIQDHKDDKRWRNSGHAWFPEFWTRKDVKNAGNYVRSLKRNKNPQKGRVYRGRYKGVTVGIYCNKGKVSSIFPYFRVNEGARKKVYDRNNKKTK